MYDTIIECSIECIWRILSVLLSHHIVLALAIKLITVLVVIIYWSA